MFVLVTPSESYVTYDDPFNVQYDLNEEEYYDERTYQGLKRYFFFNISHKFADFMQIVADYTVFFAKL
jgi:hypothetical protein